MDFFPIPQKVAPEIQELMIKLFDQLGGAPKADVSAAELKATLPVLEEIQAILASFDYHKVGDIPQVLEAMKAEITNNESDANKRVMVTWMMMSKAMSNAQSAEAFMASFCVIVPLLIEFMQAV